MLVFGKNDIWSLQEIHNDDLKQKNRNWVFVVYPDSAPADWVEQLRGLHLPFAISPLHDKDVDITGEPKKPHWHCLISFDGPTTYKNANRSIQSITNGPIVKPCYSFRGAYRYFCHFDNPEKYQYDEKDINTYNGFELTLTDADEDRIKKAIVSVILVNQICEYAELMLVLEYEFGAEYGRVVRRNHAFFTSMINSIRHSPAMTYKRFLKYVDCKEWDMYALDEQHNFENSKTALQDLIKTMEDIAN